MGTKAEELKNAAEGRGCLGKAHNDEPVFILRGHDMLAPFLVRQWARHYAMLNSTPVDVGRPGKPDIRLRISAECQAKHDEAMRLADAMQKWPDRDVPGWTNGLTPAPEGTTL